MSMVHTQLVNAHIVVGAVALVLFWIPVVVRKGSPIHIKIGRVYALAMYTVALTAFVASLMVLADPIGVQQPNASLSAEQAAERAEQFRVFSLFLLMLSILVFASLRHGLLALREKAEPGTLRTKLHRSNLIALVTTAVVVGGIGIAYQQILLMIFAVIGAIAGVGMLQDTRRDMTKPRARIYAHLNSLIGTGIGAYTAFFAFGGARFFSDLLPGQWQTIPWVLPAIIGTIATSRLKRRYAPVTGRTEAA